MDNHFIKHLKAVSSLAHKKGLSSLDLAATNGGTAASDLEAIAALGLESVNEEFEMFPDGIVTARVAFTRNLMETIYDVINELTEFETKTGPKMLSDYQKLKALLKKMQELLATMNEQHLIISRNLLNKSISKIEGRTLDILCSNDMFNFELKEVSNNPEKKGKIEYEFEMSDKILQKNWRVALDYDTILSFHQRISKSKNIPALPKFPSKPLVCVFSTRVEENFFKSIKQDIASYFYKLLGEKAYLNSLDFTGLRAMLEKFAWEDIEKQLLKGKEQIREWKEVEKKIWQHSQKIDPSQMEKLDKIREQTILVFLKEELEKLQRKYQDICSDVDLLDQNDTLWILQYDEKSKKHPNTSDLV
jgi:hypothetical protein